MKKYLPYILAVVLAGFGLLTLFLSTSVIFDLFNIRAKAGNFILFVVWANFISSLLYLFSSYGLATLKQWIAAFLGISTLILIVAFVGLQIHANSGGLYELKTVGALIFRILLTFSFPAFAYYTINKKYFLNTKYSQK